MQVAGSDGVGGRGETPRVSVWGMGRR